MPTAPKPPVTATTTIPDIERRLRLLVLERKAHAPRAHRRTRADIDNDIDGLLAELTVLKLLAETPDTP